MVKTDVLAAFLCLPEGRFKQTILVIVPCGEVIAQQTAGVAGVRVQAPESVVDVVVDHVITEQFHPLLVFAAVHVTAPFADQQGSDVLIVDVCPCVIPVVVQQGLRGEVLVKPCLVINRRTVVVGRIYDLAGSGPERPHGRKQLVHIR